MVSKGNGTNHLEKPRCRWDRSHFFCVWGGGVHLICLTLRDYTILENY